MHASAHLGHVLLHPPLRGEVPVLEDVQVLLLVRDRQRVHVVVPPARSTSLRNDSNKRIGVPLRGLQYTLSMTKKRRVSLMDLGLG